MFINKSKFTFYLFVVFSIVNLFFLLFVFLWFKSLFLIEINQNKLTGTGDKYYLNSNYTQDDDPYITSIPQLEDILTGPIISELDSSLGEKDAEITIVEFSDFRCEFCQKQEKVIKEIMEKYDGKVRFIWKDYPDNNLNSISWQAAIAGRCAEEQGKFWQYHDLLYQNSDNLSDDLFINIAVLLDLNKNTFTECLADDEIKALVWDNIAEAQALGIKGIPYIYVNDKELMGEVEFDELEEIISELMSKL